MHHTLTTGELDKPTTLLGFRVWTDMQVPRAVSQQTATSEVKAFK